MRKSKKLFKEIIKEFENAPIASSVCKKVGISRNTLYRWQKEDEKFRENIEEATKKGIDHVGDMAKSQIINKIQKGDNSMIRFWLRNNDPQYFTRKCDEEIGPEQFRVVSANINIPCKHDFCRENDPPRKHFN